MYNNNYVNSGLITGTQWDVMINFISDETEKSEKEASNTKKYEDLKTNCKWGNYKNTTLNSCEGKYCTIDENGSMMSEWKENTNKTNREGTYYTILTTGATEEVKKKNLYDIAGNLWECTQEIAGTAGTYTMLRGGSFFNDYTVRPACSRMGATFAYADGTTTGFRPVLYIK